MGTVMGTGVGTGMGTRSESNASSVPLFNHDGNYNLHLLIVSHSNTIF